MKITRKSLITGITHTMDLPVTEDQLAAYTSNRHLMIQHAFPHLTDDEREFIKTGITPEEWDATFPPEDDDEQDV